MGTRRAYPAHPFRLPQPLHLWRAWGSLFGQPAFPGPTPDDDHHPPICPSAQAARNPDEIAATEGFSDIVLRAVRDEDYDMGYKIQRGLKSGANTTFTYGRNEPGLHHYHRMVAELGGWELGGK